MKTLLKLSSNAFQLHMTNKPLRPKVMSLLECLTDKTLQILWES
jgi:hypothetical protein